MGLLSSTRYFSVKDVGLAPVAQDVMAYFREQGYRVAGEETLSRGWHISLQKGNVFKMIAGLTTALKIDLERSGDVVSAKTSVGIFGMQAIPTAITVLVYHPLLLAQLWGLVQQYKLDEEALNCVERTLMAHSGAGAAGSAGAAGAAGGPWRTTVQEVKRRFCTNCGARLEPSIKFCPECGTKV